MYSVFDIASYFIKKAIQNRNPLTPIQIMKLCYFAHGYKLALDEEPLVDELVQAWKYGPVFKDLYHALKIYGNKQINKVPDIFESDDEVFNQNDLEILDAVYESLSDMDGMSISDLTHEKDSPWSKVWTERASTVPFTPIDNVYIKDYFKKVLDEQ
ncbi:MAG: hypothetical protein OHK0056_29050 [Bacteriovoracaceae bacterium]